MIRIVVSVAAFALAIMLVLVSGLRLPFLKSSNQTNSSQKRTNSPGLLDRILNRDTSASKQPLPSATGYSTNPTNQGQSAGQSPPLTATQTSPGGTSAPAAAPFNAPQPANPRADGTQSPVAQPASPTGIPTYRAESTSSASRGTADDRPPASAPSSTTQPPVRGAW